MTLRTLVKLAVGSAAGAVALVGVANAAPLAPSAAQQLAAPQSQAVQQALVSQDEANSLKPTEVRWGHRGWHRGGWHRGWHRHHWRRHWR